MANRKGSLGISGSTWAEIGLLALASLFGMPLLRALPRVIFFTFRFLPGVSHLDMVLLAFGVFLISFLAAAVRRLLNAPAALTLTAGGMVVAHLVQLLSQSPRVELVAVTVGLGCYLLFLPLYLGHLRGQGVEGMSRYGIGLLLGLTLDSGRRGIWEFWRLSEQSTSLLLFSLTLALLLLSCLASVVARSSSQSHSDGDFLPTLPVLALGPFLLTQVLLYQNLAYLTVLSQLPRLTVLGSVVVMNILGMAAFIFVIKHSDHSLWLVVAFGTVTTLMPLLARVGGFVTMGAILVGYVLLAGMLGLIMVSLAHNATRSGLWRTAIANGTGMFLFIFLLFILSLVLLPAPYNDFVSLPTQVSTIIVGLCALTATRQQPSKSPLTVKATLTAPPWRLFQKILLLLLLFLLAPATLLWQKPQPTSGSGLPVRVMTYNMHTGLNSLGQLSLAEQARVIEESQADIVALQEVSRGSYLSGSFDTLTWLSQRLQMPYIYGPTEILATGNAILSRYPIRQSGHDLLPGSIDERVQARAYLWAKIDVGQGQHLLVIVAHLHSNGGQISPVRSLQVQTLLDQWQGEQPAVIMGDMNAYPEMAEMAMLRAAGLKDAFEQAGSGNGHTFPATAPTGRIDYIWLSPDLSASNVVIPATDASDHLPVVVTIRNGN